MNNLQKIILYTTCLSCPMLFSDKSLAEEAKQDTTKINMELLTYKSELEQHPIFSRFFDSYVQYDPLDFYNNPESTKINKLEKRLEENFNFFIESKNKSIKNGFEIYFDY